MLFTEKAIIIKAILHAKILGTRESCIQVLRKEKVILKILWTICRMSASLFSLVYDPLRGSTIEVT